MASNYTEHYQLNQWEPTDQVLREEFNADNAKIDAALAAKGNCRIVTGSYTGTGTYGSGNPRKLTFDAAPLLLFVYGTGDTYSFWAAQGCTACEGSLGSNTGVWIALSWNENTVSWYNATSADKQLNTSGKVYRYAALVAVE